VLGIKVGLVDAVSEATAVLRTVTHTGWKGCDPGVASAPQESAFSPPGQGSRRQHPLKFEQVYLSITISPGCRY